MVFLTVICYNAYCAMRIRHIVTCPNLVSLHNRNWANLMYRYDNSSQIKMCFEFLHHSVSVWSRLTMHPSHGHAGERSRTLSHIWSDNRLPRQLKLRLYAACVCSTLTHGSEAWTLTPSAMKALNCFNSRQLHRITGRPYRDEATHPSYDLLAAIRLRRHRWLGHILRMPPERLLHRAVRALGQRGGPPYQPGSLLMDATLPMDQLSLRATDRTLWARDGRSLPPLQESS